MPTKARRIPTNCEQLKKLIREVPDFPKKGILFYDITTLLKDKLGFATLIDAWPSTISARHIDLVLGMEARGFIFGPALAYRLNAGFVPVRKPGKLPAATARVDYDLEYGTTRWRSTKTPSKRPASAHRGRPACHRRHGRGHGETGRVPWASIAGLAFVVELDFLKGRDKLKPYDVFSFCTTTSNPRFSNPRSSAAARRLLVGRLARHSRGQDTLKTAGSMPAPKAQRALPARQPSRDLAAIAGKNLTSYIGSVFGSQVGERARQFPQAWRGGAGTLRLTSSSIASVYSARCIGVST